MAGRGFDTLRFRKNTGKIWKKEGHLFCLPSVRALLCCAVGTCGSVHSAVAAPEQGVETLHPSAERKIASLLALKNSQQSAGSLNKVVGQSKRAEHITVKAGNVYNRQPVQLDGATKTSFSAAALAAIPGGANASVSSVMLQAPGVVQDSFGQLHIRGDHANIQYRLNGVALPDGASMFSQALTTRFAHDMSLTDGALPAKYGFRQSGVIDIDTRTGARDPGLEGSVYGGARDYFQPSAVLGEHVGKWDVFLTADGVHNRVGIENPTSKFNAPHDLTNQYHVLGRVAYQARPETEFSVMGAVGNGWFQLPNNPSQQHQFQTPIWSGHAPTDAPASGNLKEHQAELGDFGIFAWKETHENVQAVTSAVVRNSAMIYSPDWVGDLIYNGVAESATRSVFTAGMQNDTTWKVAPKHTLRMGFQGYGERGLTKTNAQVFPQLPNGNFSRNTVNIRQEAGKTGAYGGFYGEDEWRATRCIVFTYGFRFDGVDEYAHATQFSPRAAVVWKPWAGGHFHLSFARYFTPPSLEAVTPGNPAAYKGTSGETPGRGNTPVKVERANYIDGGWTQTLARNWTLTADAYYKHSHNLIDDGQFGAPIVMTSFNYRHGKAYGAEFTSNYTLGALNLYGNMAWSKAYGKDITSSQWAFTPQDMSYIKSHWVHLDHDQKWAASAGAVYRFMRTTQHPFQLSATMVYGSGLRKDMNGIPNGGHVPQYATFNLGMVQDILFRKADMAAGTGARSLQFRLDVINLFDKTYKLRDGSGIGVGAPQYGLRRTVMGGIAVRL